jgi:hypothetical protein
MRTGVLLGVLLAGLWGTACAQAMPGRGPAPDRPELRALPDASAGATVRLRVWGFEVYDARLWTLAGFDPQRRAEHAFALELVYLRRLQGAAIAQRSVEEMQRLGTLADAQREQWLERLRQLFPDVAPGDRLTGVHWPGRGAEFWHNGRRLGQIEDLRLASLFFGIWLDEKTSEPGLRAQMLQGLRP